MPNRAAEPNGFLVIRAEAVRAASNIRLLASFGTVFGTRQLRARNSALHALHDAVKTKTQKKKNQKSEVDSNPGHYVHIVT
jgi:hypothetical protein